MKIRPAVSTLIAIIDNDDVLLIKRNVEPFKDLWGLPGGKLELGEHVEDAAVREAKEETGLDTEFVAVRGVLSEIITEEGNKWHFIHFVSELKPKSRDFKASEEGELKWIPLKDMETLKLIPSEWSIIKEFILNKNSINVHKSHVKKNGTNYDLEKFGV